MDVSRISEALDQAPIGVWLLDKEGRIEWVNSALADLFGVSAEEIIGQSEAKALTHYLIESATNSKLYQVVAGAETNPRWVMLIANTEEAHSRACYFVDGTEMLALRTECDRLKAQLAGASTTDPLTGVLNKRALLTALEPQVSRSRRYQNPLSIVAMDLAAFQCDGCERQPTTEEVLTSVAFFLRDQLRWVDLIGRTGEQEFMLVLPETKKKDCELLIQKLVDRMDGLTLPDQAEGSLSVDMNFGVTAWQKGDDVTLLLDRVREALAKALLVPNPTSEFL